MDAFISGNWRLVRRGEVTVGAVRNLTRGEIYRSGVWRSIARFTSTLTVSASGVSGYNLNTNNRPARVTSDTAQATPSGGLGPYSYAWAIISGSAAANSPNMAATSFSQTVTSGVTEDSIARVTCTDSLGSVATADITVSLTNESNQ